MRKIAEIVKDIREELGGAEHYAKLAAQHVVRIIQDHRSKNMVSHTAKVKALLEMAKK